ncbi:MAG: hypothetical protein HYR85_25600 [Planctomycetes bacterium]|nr:hypothetical protein [Planctomycetota bacterium]MBI3847744.1 hypothetical protein [Planctomycetota bacterium]
MALTGLAPGLTAALIAAVAFLVWVSWPLLRRDAPPSDRTPRELFMDALETEKHYVYASILDLDADFKAGKIDSSEHQRLREALLGEAARLLTQLDELESTAPKSKKG